MNQPLADSVEQLLSRAHEAIDLDDVAEAARLLAQVGEKLDAGDPRLLHLQGLYAWAEGEVEDAAALLGEAVDREAQDSRVYFDCAELMLSSGLDLDLAEAGLRALLEREGLSVEESDQAKTLLAQICLEQVDVDADEAMELLEGVSDEAKSEAYWISAKAAVLLEQGRGDEAIALWKTAAEDPEAAKDPDLHYQLGLCYALSEREEEAIASMQKVLELDIADDEYDALDRDESEGLRSCLEEVFEGIPEELLKRIASAPIEVQTRPTAAQVARGVDPRAFVAFDGDAEQQALRAVVVMRNVLLDELEDEEQLAEAMIGGLVDEFRRFFGLDELTAASV